MKVRPLVVLLPVLVAPLSLCSHPAGSDETPVGERWWPSEWGPGDERGAANRITAGKVLEAVRLIRKGEIYQLGRVYEPEMPLFGERHYSLTQVGAPSGGPFGTNRIVWNEEMFTGEIAQIGTQLDGLGHIGVRVGDRDLYYNGLVGSEFVGPYGLEKLGVEKAGVFFTRGVLIDVARHRKAERLETGYEITPDDLRGALEAQGVEIRPGDAVLIRTGHGRLWKTDNPRYNEGEPGIGVDAARWLIDRKVVLIGGDSTGTEVVPAADPERVWEVHQWLIPKSGIYNLENLDLEPLARDRVYEFAFIFAPLRLKGASGSPGNPIAVR